MSSTLPQIIAEMQTGEVEPWLLLQEMLDQPEERDRVIIGLLVAAIEKDRRYIIESNLANPEWTRPELNRVWETLRDLESTLTNLIPEGK